jgi:hypothetical protein
VRISGRAAGERDLGDRGDGGQRLAAKTHRRDALELVERRDLARRVAAQRERELVAFDALAIVLDDDLPHAATGELDRDLRGAGVERVVDQLAHHRGRPLDHLAGGDLADQRVGQLADRAARRVGGGQGQGGVHAAIVAAGSLPRCGTGTTARGPRPAGPS